MIIRKIKHLNKIKNLYIALYNKCYDSSPFISYDWLHNTKLGREDKNIFRTLCLKEITYVIYDDLNEAVFIAPLIIEKTPGKKIIHNRGFNTNAEPLGFLYKPGFDKFDIFFDRLKRDFKNFEIQFIKFLSNDPFADYCNNHIANSVNEGTLSFQMEFNDYNEWFASLSKSRKQTIRTSYNRLATDGKELKFKFYFSKKLSHSEYNKTMKIMSKRLYEHMNLKDRFMRFAIFFLKKHNINSIALNNSRLNFYALLYIDNELVAFSNGLFDHGNMIVSRLASDSKYFRYQPGAILHNELFKELDKRKIKTKYNFSQGAEQYKKDYGGLDFQYIDINIKKL